MKFLYMCKINTLICVTEYRPPEEVIVGKSRDLHEGVEPTQNGNIQQRYASRGYKF